ncbi:MAG: hypothetical protein AAF657_19140 [Acidobacteriota bacterium]
MLPGVLGLQPDGGTRRDNDGDLLLFAISRIIVRQLDRAFECALVPRHNTVAASLQPRHQQVAEVLRDPGLHRRRKIIRGVNLDHGVTQPLVVDILHMDSELARSGSLLQPEGEVGAATVTGREHQID